MQKIRWGILGLGNIAKQFARGVAAIPNDAELLAVGSRTQEKADAFAKEFNAARAYGSYEALVKDPDVDAIYVSSPHTGHMEHSILCLNHGKPVLCEKPFAINAKQVAAMIKVARKQKVFLMEAMWTRFLPTTAKVRELLKAKAIGDVRMVVGDFGFRAGFNPQSRLFNPALGGGGLLDVGIYPLSYVHMVYGKPPAQIAGLAEIGQSGVDEQAAWVFKYDTGAMAIMYTGVRTTTPMEILIIGTDGRIKGESPFWKGTKLTVTAGGKTETIECPLIGNGYSCEALEVGNCLRAGKLESDLLPLDESLAIMKTMDKVRAQWKLKYPGE